MKNGQATEITGNLEYTGQFHKDQRCGHGVLKTYYNQERSRLISEFTGEFENGVPHGRGELSEAGKVHKGFWENGVMIAFS